MYPIKKTKHMTENKTTTVGNASKDDEVFKNRGVIDLVESEGESARSDNRRSSVSSIPSMLYRCNSTGSTGSNSSSSKRKARESLRPDEIVKRLEDPIVSDILEALEQVGRARDGLKKRSKNLPIEIKGLVEFLNRGVDILRRQSVVEWLGERRFTRAEIPKYDADTQWEEMTDKVVSLAGVDSYDRFAEIYEKDWEGNLFQRTEVVIGNPIKGAEESQVVFVEEDDRGMERSIQRMYRDKYEELELMNEEFEFLEICTRTRAGMSKRMVHKVQVSEKMDEIWDKLVQLRETLKGREVVSMHHLRCMEVLTFRKMVEAVFRDEHVVVKFYTTGQVEKGGKAKQATGRKSYALVVDEEGTQYGDILSKIRPALLGSEGGEAIQEVRSTRGGKLLITLEKDKEAFEKIKARVEATVGSVRAKIVDGDGKKTTFFIRGLDELATKDEVREALIKALGEDKLSRSEVVISDPRRNARNTKAVTVTLRSDLAERLLSRGNLRVGLANCGVARRLSVPSCRKCYSYDHLAKDCVRKEQLGERCFRCYKEGHMARDCKSEQLFCPACKEEGHKMGSGKCPSFNRALAKKRVSGLVKQGATAKVSDGKGQNTQEAETSDGSIIRRLVGLTPP